VTDYGRNFCSAINLGKNKGINMNHVPSAVHILNQIVKRVLRFLYFSDKNETLLPFDGHGVDDIDVDEKPDSVSY
jgi:hypothetical protein